MNLLVEPSSHDLTYIDDVDGLILALKDFSVESFCSFTLEEIKDILLKTDKKIYVKVNRNFFNEDLELLEEVLKQLSSLKVAGVFFYDLAVLEIKRKNKLSLPLIWNQTHMVNNYRTCDYYYDKGVSYALLGKEITLEEIIEIIKKSKIHSMVEVVSLPSVAFSKRHLVSHYYDDLGEKGGKQLLVKEKVSGDFYQVIEDDYGTCFYLNRITNGTSILKDLMDAGCEYVIFREYGVPSFSELVKDTKKYLSDGCCDTLYLQKYEELGDSTNFFFKKTIYKVK